MARKLPGTAIQAGTINITQLSTTVVSDIAAGSGPKVATITYPGGASAVSNSGNESIVLTGTGFESGVQVYVNGGAVPAVSRANANSLSFTTPALSTGATYPIYIVNPDGGTAVFVPGMVVSAGPVWVTNSNLTSWGASSALSRNLEATSDSTVSYALEAGSTLPSGLSLAANGILSGTLSSPPESETTYNFTVVATDLETQKSSKAFNITATIGITATGGTVSNISGYRVHTFTSSGTFEVVSGTGTVDYLVVAGGGGGAVRNGAGGGGAGGFRVGSSYPVTAGNTYTVTVGAGGAGGEDGTAPYTGANGTSSIFDTITSAGGGGGGFGAGFNGGSGGGGGRNSPNAGGLGNTPTTSPSQGNNGGNGFGGGGGGGGASAVGQTGLPNNGGVGGSGAASSITGTSVTYAGGGGGSGYDGNGNGGAGGDGGGGAGATIVNGVGPSGTAGTTNTGGGGGGGGYNGAASIRGGAGGSGIVIIRYAA